MKTMQSTEFRTTYHTLKEPTQVTALGRVIGTWIPVRFVPADELLSAPKAVPKPIGKKK